MSRSMMFSNQIASSVVYYSMDNLAFNKTSCILQFMNYNICLLYNINYLYTVDLA